MANKTRNVDVLSVTITSKSTLDFVDILNYVNQKEYRTKDKIINFSLHNCTIEGCVIGMVITTQNADIPPKRDKENGNCYAIQIDLDREGFAYANVFLYDIRRNVLIYEINKNGCFPNLFAEYIYYHWNAEESHERFDIKFPSVCRANEYQRMLRMDYYKKLKIELLNPVELLRCFQDENDSLSNLLKQHVSAGQESNADIITIEQLALRKKINPMGLSHSLVKGLIDAVKANIADTGHQHNIQTLKVEGYTYDSEDSKKCKPVDLLADSFKESFKIPNVRVHSDLQQRERTNGIEDLYKRILPEIQIIRGE
ncbi:MAG: hypothetical protein IJ634_05310 [Bacteroidales bacterium]|nr:hypothetical protein [Bacteroidales bacterium]